MATMKRNLVRFDSEYNGARWRYGLQYRPLGYAQVPDGYIIHSDREDSRFAYGTVDYPRQLTDTELARFQLVAVSE